MREPTMERLLSQKSFGMERKENQRPVAIMSVERMVSQKAMQAASSSSCKASAVGFLCGVCITYFLLAVGTSFTRGTLSLDGVHFYLGHGGIAGDLRDEEQAQGKNFWKLEHQPPPRLIPEDLSYKGGGGELKDDGGFKFHKKMQEKEKVATLHSLWEAFYINSKNKSDPFWNAVGVDWSTVPKAPHIQNCKVYVGASKQLDTRGGNGSRPPWSIWKGYLGLQLHEDVVPKDEEEELLLENRTIPQGTYPPWVEGGDEDNLPMTRRVQRDIWLHQHPRNCHDPHLKFLFTDWESNPGFGIGAQIAGMAGMLALAVNQNRILVTNYYNRADHKGCKGSNRSRWSCYFLPETSAECRERALELASQADAQKQGIITTKENYTTKDIWVGRIPRQWGKPWESMQPTTEINGKLLKHYRTRDTRWWRAQAVRYLMRFQTEYTCELLNIARHQAFGMKAAKMILQTLPPEWPKVAYTKYETEIERYVWANQKLWAPRPLMSIHVRLGDKAAEMKMVRFESYMNLAKHIRQCFPDVKNIWLSTEMQEVIDQSKTYLGWNFYYTNVTRQLENMTMPAYEDSLGRETSTNYPLVNFLIAADADFFIGALGSTWCFLVDGMRSTGGKVMAGYLSVNKDRFW